jgi:hypothetical protein
MNRLYSIAGAILLLTSVGCISPDRHVDDHWGESYTELKYQQIQNPNAGDTVKPVEGLGATTADHVTTNYHVRQEEQPQDQNTESVLDLINAN